MSGGARGGAGGLVWAPARFQPLESLRQPGWSRAWWSSARGPWNGPVGKVVLRVPIGNTTSARSLSQC